MPRILYCRCAFAQAVPDDVKDGVLKSLCESALPFETVSDLCEMSARHDPHLKTLADTREGDTLKIAACEPRAVKWLFHAAGAPLPDDDSVQVLNMRDQTAAEVSQQLQENA
jgi:hypothetical protein